MGERSQMYVKAERTYQMHDESWRTDKGFLPLYFQWNVPENMVARAKQMIYTNMYDYLLVSGKKAWEHEVQAMTEVNYSANKGNPSFSHASNLKKEIRDNIKDAPRWKGREFTKEEKWEEMSSVFYCDNNHGCFYLSVSINQECNYDYSQMKKISDAIDECKQYITETINQNEDYSEAYENSVLYVKNNLKQFYLDKNTHIEKSDVSHDNFFIYGNLSLSGLTKGDVSFTYEKDNCHIEVDLSKLEGAVSEEMKDVIYNKCYDMSDLELESIEQEKHNQKYEEEIDDDPYGERSLF